MREIKFRFWNKEYKKFISPYGLGYQFQPENGQVYVEGMNITDRFNISQFTGLKDKNGKEIYEGDIVEEPYFSNVNPKDHDDEDYIDDKPRIHMICYDYKQAKFKMVPESFYNANAGNGGWTGYDVKYERITVIGNIYES